MDDNLKILDYWRRRPILNTREWEDFYRLVTPLLMRTKLPPDFSEQSRRSALVVNFFADKIFLNAATTRARPLVHMHALHGYLTRYALDILSADENCAPLDEMADDRPAPVAPPAHEQLLSEAGIQVPAALDSADRFLASLSVGEQAYLRHNTCADIARAEPISAIAKRFQMGTSYHSKARALGITLRAGLAYRGYARTRIGQWLLAAGAQLSNDWREEIAALIALLCERARNPPREAS